MYHPKDSPFNFPTDEGKVQRVCPPTFSFSLSLSLLSSIPFLLETPPLMAATAVRYITHGQQHALYVNHSHGVILFLLMQSWPARTAFDTKGAIEQLH